MRLAIISGFSPSFALKFNRIFCMHFCMQNHLQNTALVKQIEFRKKLGHSH